MKDLPPSSETDPLAGKVRGAQPARGKPAQVVAFDFRKAGQVSGKQFQSLTLLHETFARNLSFSLGASLCKSLEVTLLSIEPLSCEAFLQQLSEITYLASVTLPPLEAVAAIEIDPAIAFPMIDLLLGGAGNPEPQPRAITEIEEQLLESVGKMICQELQSIWQPYMGMELRFDRRLQQTQFHLLMPANERIIVLSFEIGVGEARGLLKVVFPAMVSNALLRRLSQQWTHRKRPTMPNKSEHLRERLQDCSFGVQLVLTELRVPLRELLTLESGRVLQFKHRVKDPALLLVSGREMFAAHPVASGPLRAARVQQRIQISSISERNQEDE